MPAENLQAVKNRFSIVGVSPKLDIAIQRAMLVAPIDLSVLVIGESGSGKEFFPKIIHDNSTRKHKKYIAVNCGAIPEGTIDSELFGHMKGSFTGAVADHKGYFEEANGGTIFLDEVAELPMTTQARLLRVLESGEYMRVGSSEVKKADIRIVAATNKDMEKAIKEGKFREDLYYRLSTVQIDVPPLRERGRDISLLIRFFNGNFANKYGTPRVEYSDDAKRAMEGFHWPGNVRQLKNIVEQIALFEAGKTITSVDVRRYLPSGELVVAGNPTQHYDYAMERDVLFKMIGHMQEEIVKLRAMVEEGATVHQPSSHINVDVAQLRREGRQLSGFHDRAMHHDSMNDTINIVASQAHPLHSMDVTPAEEVSEATAYEIEHAPIRTLEDTERKTITEALERNKGRRKRTAEELNISERTLYRKIKEYGLESRNQRKNANND